MSEKHPLVGKTINNTYQVWKVIANKINSTVFHVSDLENGQAFAMKTLDKDYGKNWAFMNELTKQINIQSKLNDEAYKHIVKPIEVGIIESTNSEEDGSPFIIMEFMRYGSLNKHYKFTLEQKLYCIAESTKGLETAHNNKDSKTGQPLPILHLNYHSRNILLGINKREIDEVKVSDFGIGALMECTGYYSMKSERPIRYLSIEQTRYGEDQKLSVSPKTDVYQVGATLLEMTTGMEPRPGYEKVLNQYQDVPGDLKTLIQNCLEFYPEDRPTMSNVRSVLNKIIGGI